MRQWWHAAAASSVLAAVIALILGIPAQSFCTPADQPPVRRPACPWRRSR